MSKEQRARGKGRGQPPFALCSSLFALRSVSITDLRFNEFSSWVSAMSEREDTGFKITDRRKYNPDGSPREETEETHTVAEPDAEPPSQQSSAGKILSFPGEPSNKQPQQPTPPPPANIPDQPQTSGPRAADKAPEISQAEQAYNQARGPASARLPEGSFLSLVNMLGVEAAMHLGLIQTPGEEPLPVDTEAARHMIDLLGVLQSKTRGNLTAEEDQLFENMLADLRMQFVAVSRRR